MKDFFEMSDLERKRVIVGIILEHGPQRADRTMTAARISFYIDEPRYRRKENGEDESSWDLLKNEVRILLKQLLLDNLINCDNRRPPFRWSVQRENVPGLMKMFEDEEVEHLPTPQ